MTRLLTDEPIRTAEQDRLNRGGFAKTLAEQILATDDAGCVVIGIHGPYGSGKSSLLNIVEGEVIRLGATQERSPIVVRFNPWNFSTVDQLVLMFFSTLGTALGRMDQSATARVISEKLEQFGELLAPIGVLIGERSIWALLLKVPNAVARLLRKRGREQTPEQAKEELDGLLQSYGRRVIVIVDDIDRLEPEKIRLVFRLIRLNADFHNTTYLLAFDRAIAERALTEEGFPGRAYLEKIVQVPFDLPRVEEQPVAEVLFEELNTTLGDIEEGEGAWDNRRWANVYHLGFKGFFKTIRDVKRYVNVVRISFAGSIRDEVNPIDFLVLEVLRVFCPDAYRLLPSRKDILTHTSFSMRNGRNKDEDKAAMDVILDAAGEHSVITKELLMELFPPLAEVYGNTSYPSSWQVEWRRGKRVCAEDVFDKYFLFDIPTGDISERTVRQALELAGNREGLATLLLSLNKQGLAVRLLERLEDFTETLPVEKVPGSVYAVLDIMDELPQERRGFFDLGSDVQAMRIAFRLLRRIPAEEERLRIAKEAIETANSVHGVVHFASWLQRTEEEKKRGREPALSEDGQRQVLATALSRVRGAASGGTLHRGPHLAYTLFRWRDWSGEEEPKSYVSQLISSDEGLLAFLKGFLQQHQSHTLGERMSRTTWVIDRGSIGKLADVEELVERAGRITENLDPDGKRVVDALLKPINEEDDE